MTIIGSARLSADDPKQAAAEGAEAGKVQSHTGDPAPPLQPPADVVQWNDPGFDHYVDLSLLQRALTESDAEMLTDAALQFAEGERVLLRSHKMIKAGELLTRAADLALQAGDESTLDRLEQAAERNDDKEFLSRLKTDRKLGGASRAAEPEVVVSIQNTPPHFFQLYRALSEGIRLARLTKDISRVPGIESVIAVLDDEQIKASLTDMVAEAKSAIGDQHSETASTLSKLMGAAEVFAIKARSGSIKADTSKIWEANAGLRLTRMGGTTSRSS